MAQSRNFFDRFRAVPVSAVVLTIAALAILLALGTWQMQRLGWKQALLTDLERAYQQVPQALSFADLADFARDAGAYDFLPGRIAGAYVPGQDLLIGMRTHEGRPGYHLVSVLRWQDEPAAPPVLVNRGWVPLDFEPQSYRQDREKSGAASEFFMVQGIVRMAELPSFMALTNDPAQGQWHNIDPAEMAAYFGYEALAPAVLYAVPEGSVRAPPLGFTRESWQIPNNHRDYALTWYALALVLAGVFYARFLRRA